jgi:hypothetical protein
VKRRAPPWLGFDGDLAAVPLNDFLADGQANPGARELVPFVQPLKHSEYFVEVLRIDSQTVVVHGE